MAGLGDLCEASTLAAPAVLARLGTEISLGASRFDSESLGAVAAGLGTCGVGALFREAISLPRSGGRGRMTDTTTMEAATATAAPVHAHQRVHQARDAGTGSSSALRICARETGSSKTSLTACSP